MRTISIRPVGRLVRAGVLPFIVAIGAPLVARAQSAPLDTAKILAAARPDIDAANDAWIPGMNARNAAMITAAYADSGIFVGADGSVIRGRAAITAMYASRFPKLPPHIDGGVQTDRLTVVTPDLIYESGHAWIELPATTAGAPPARRGGNYLTVWHREADGHWRITRNLSL